MFWRRKNREEETGGEPVKYEVLVELDDPTALDDVGVVQNVLRRVEIWGQVFHGVAFCQTSDYSDKMCRSFSLTDQSDFGAFSEAVINIDGVTGVRKGGGPWDRTWKEKWELKRLKARKKRASKDSFKKRKKQSEELTHILDEMEKRVDKTYGTGAENAEVTRSSLRELIESLGECEVDAFCIVSDILAGGFMYYNRATRSFGSGEGVAEFLAEALNTTLAVPMTTPKVTDFYAVPFHIDYREKGGRRYVRLTAGAGKPTFMIASIEIHIMETNPKEARATG
jgi:hypothetical protein